MSSSQYDFWLLDLDGTLVDVDPQYIHEVFDGVGQRLGLSFSDREAELLWYGIGDARDGLLAEHGIDPEHFWDVFHSVEEPKNRAAATHLYDDAELFVPDIDEPVGVVTHCQEYLTGPVLETLDIEDWFDTVVCCTDETGWKPDPGPVELAMTDLGVAHNGHTGVLVGDDPRDVGAAHNSGLSSVHVRRRSYEHLLPDGGNTGPSVDADQRIGSLTDLDG